MQQSIRMGETHQQDFDIALKYSPINDTSANWYLNDSFDSLLNTCEFVPNSSDLHLGNDDLDTTLPAASSQMSGSSESHIKKDLRQLGLAIESDISVLKVGNIPRNTLSKRRWAIDKFNKWVLEHNNVLSQYLDNHYSTSFYVSEFIPTLPLQNFSISQLNYSVSRFIAEIRDESNNLFRPKTLKDLILQLQQAINQELINEEYKFLSDLRFKQIKGTRPRTLFNRI